MESNTKKLIMLIIGTLLFIVAIISASYAYFVSSIDEGGNKVSGSTYSGFNIDLTVTALKSGTLIPLDDNLISTAVNRGEEFLCVDSRGYDVCSFYQINFSNVSDSIVLNGYLKTQTGTTYSTSNLKYQLFTYDGYGYNPVSDIGTISSANNTANYFTYNNSNLDFSITNSGINYYLAIWLNNINDNQMTDENTKFVGNIYFVSSNGTQVVAKFIN